MTEATLLDDEDSETGWRDGEGRYGLMSRLNHWITAAVFLGALLLGLVLGYAGLSREAEAPLRRSPRVKSSSKNAGSRLACPSNHPPQDRQDALVGNERLPGRLDHPAMRHGDMRRERVGEHVLPWVELENRADHPVLPMIDVGLDPSFRREHAPDGQVQALRLALAGAVHDRGDGRPSARQDPAVARPAARSRGGGAGGGADADRSAGGDHPLDRRLDGEGAGISVSSVQRIWRAHGLQPHRVRQFKLSNDPQFVAKLRDLVGLYLDPPAHAIVLSVDEKSQIQALDRTQPGLPLKKGRAGTMTLQAARHDHALRGAERARRHRHRPQHGPPPPPGVHPLPQRHRARGSGRKGRPRHS
jgi:hypothetical protein